MLANEIEDEVRWMLTKGGVFYVKSMFEGLQSTLNEPFPSQMVRRSRVHRKINFFIREVGLGGKFNL